MLLSPHPCNLVLLQRGYKVRALTRKPEQTKQLFSNHPNLEVGIVVYTHERESTRAAGEASAVPLETQSWFGDRLWGAEQVAIARVRKPWKLTAVYFSLL
jgi:uncharacterized protein YbjT (DUF2867 family)